MKLFRIGLNKLNVLLMIVFCMGCDKEDNTSFSLEDGKSTVVYDLAGDTKASMSDGIDGKEQRDFYTFLFRFQDKKQIWIRTKADSTQWLKTDQWDIAFTGQYNSNIYINNAQNVGNPGYEGPSDNTAIILVNQPYEQVSTAPLDSEFDNSTIKMVGWADASAPHGWFNYSTTTHIMKALPNKTYVLRLPNGKYAKLQLISAYKGNPPAVTDMFWPAPYLTFRYYVQADGSKNLRTN